MFVNDPTGICIVPIMRKYYSDALIVVPINSHIPKLPMAVNQIIRAGNALTLITKSLIISSGSYCEVIEWITWPSLLP